MKERVIHRRMKTQASLEETRIYRNLAKLLQITPIPSSELLANLSLYLTRSTVSQILFMSHVYSLILDVHGVIMEFGNRWGRNLALLSSLRNIFEAHNYGRKIIGFDTFEGFPTTTPEDGQNPAAIANALSVAPNYQKYLNEVLQLHERLSPRPQLRRFETVKGDVEKTLPVYLETHPETIIALAYFDMDLYRPTRAALEAIRPYLGKGSIVGFDELCLSEFPGETLALRQVFDISTCRLVRLPFSGHQSYIVM